MTQEQFARFASALPDEFAEEAYRPLPKKRVWQALGALAACLAVAAAVWFTLPQTADRAAGSAEYGTMVTEEAAPAEAAAPESVEQSTAATETTAESAVDAGDVYARQSHKAILPPPDAENVETMVACGEDEYSSCTETIFRLNGVRCTVRQQAARPEASTLTEAINAMPAELQSELEQSAEGTVDGVPAILRWNEGQEGQIFWQVGGELYCLTMDAGASADALTAMAEQVFVTVIE